MRLKQQIDSMQTRLASQWLEALKESHSEDRAAFDEWCRESPLHIREFLEVAYVEQALDVHDFDKGEQSEQLIAVLKGIASSATVVPLSLTQHGRRGANRARRGWIAGIAASAAAAIIGLTVLIGPWRGSRDFKTQVGEQRIVELGDASQVTLNTNSDILVAFEPESRDVELRRGEALFRVSHDAKRPFRVHTKAGTVQAIGTQFNVYERDDGTEVSVVEGRVRLSTRNRNGPSGRAELGVGEQARMGLDGVVHRMQEPDVGRATSWSQRRLKFDNAPLEDMVEELNRYQRDTKLRIDGVVPGSHHYSGIFDPDAPQAFGKFLAREPDLRIEETHGEIRIRPRIEH